VMETLRLGAARGELNGGSAAGAKRERRASFAQLDNISRRNEEPTAEPELLAWQAKCVLVAWCPNPRTGAPI
jgi:hypothetical protein